jgi:hypothetical protein
MWEEVIRLNIFLCTRRLYEPSSGEICLDGADIRTLDPSWLRYITVIDLGHGVPQGYVWHPLLPRPRGHGVCRYRPVIFSGNGELKEKKNER